MVKDGSFIPDLMFVQQFGQFLMRKIGKRQQEFFITMLADNFNQIIDGAGTEEYLAFPVNNIFLQIKCYRFRNTEIFHEYREQ